MPKSFESWMSDMCAEGIVDASEIKATADTPPMTATEDEDDIPNHWGDYGYVD